MLEKIETFAEKHRLFPPNGLVLAAVSGGADSVCLLEALLLLSEKYGFTVAAMHYNHRLRGAESDRDAFFVESLCLDKKIALYTGSGDVSAYADDSGCGIEEAARRLRYVFFHETADKLKAERIATAHTADDNAETVLLNLTRGAGLRGLGGIPPVRGIIIRPMLEVSRSEVLAFLSSRALSYMEDSTNAQLICSRNIVRHRVVPVLKELNPRLTESVQTTAALLREDEAYLQELADVFLSENANAGSFGEQVTKAKSLALLPLPVARRVVRTLAGRAAGAGHVSAVLALCASADVSGEVSLPGCTVYREYDRLVFSQKAALHDDAPGGFEPVELEVGGSVLIPELGLRVSYRRADDVLSAETSEFTEKINKSFHTFLFNYDKLYGKIVIRPRKTGDKIDLYGRNGTKSLKKLFIENRIPVRKRPLIPVVADDGGVIGVYGLGFDKRTVCRAGDVVAEIIFEETAYET
jgi:tRNA(Ile)-lysidine synthase